jgi:hypothetical protein
MLDAVMQHINFFETRSLRRQPSASSPNCRGDREGFTSRHSIAIAAVAILGCVPLVSVTAQPVISAYPAPYPDYYPDANWDLPPDGVLAIVRSKGLEPLSRPQRHGATYALSALDPADRKVQVTVDARSGRILSVSPTGGAAAPNPNPYPEGVEQQGHNARAAKTPRPNVAPTAKLKADFGDSKSGAAAARPLPKIVGQTADAPLLSTPTEAPVQAMQGSEYEE